MPGWHEKTAELQAQGRLQLAGIVQEQHPERARLFMQWKQMSWPVMVDSLNLLGVEVVPITLLIDEAGVVQAVNPDAGALERFLGREPAEAEPAFTATRPEPLKQAEDLFHWGSRSDLHRVVEIYRSALERQPDDAPSAFRLGVALRRRYDSPERQEGDFQASVRAWQQALDLNPNQYIWRRRIQQYGPRLDKPYPFYDWVPRARREIAERGGTPVALPVEPSGAEFASPGDFGTGSAAAAGEPDAEGRIHRDEKGFVLLESTVVPDRLEPGGTARVHLAFRPNAEIQAHWNNEVGGLVVWLRPPDGWQVDARVHDVAGPPAPVSLETRRVEFEVRVPGGPLRDEGIPGYALYYVCEDVGGTCLYRRRDFVVPVRTGR